MKTRRLFALCTVLLMLFALAGCESKAVMENAPGAAMDSYKPAETMAAAIGRSRAQKILVPLNRCHTTVVGLKELTMSELVQEAVDIVVKAISCQTGNCMVN